MPITQIETLICYVTNAEGKITDVLVPLEIWQHSHASHTRMLMEQEAIANVLNIRRFEHRRSLEIF